MSYQVSTKHQRSFNWNKMIMKAYSLLTLNLAKNWLKSLLEYSLHGFSYSHNTYYCSLIVILRFPFYQSLIFCLNYDLVPIASLIRPLFSCSGFGFLGFSSLFFSSSEYFVCICALLIISYPSMGRLNSI